MQHGQTLYITYTYITLLFHIICVHVHQHVLYTVHACCELTEGIYQSVLCALHGCMIHIAVYKNRMMHYSAVNGNSQ